MPVENEISSIATGVHSLGIKFTNSTLESFKFIDNLATDTLNSIKNSLADISDKLSTISNSLLTKDSTNFDKISDNLNNLSDKISNNSDNFLQQTSKLNSNLENINRTLSSISYDSTSTSFPDSIKIHQSFSFTNLICIIGIIVLVIFFGYFIHNIIKNQNILIEENKKQMEMNKKIAEILENSTRKKTRGE